MEVRNLINLHPNPNNDRITTKADFERCVKNMLMGDHSTFLITPEGMVIDGNTRLRAAKDPRINWETAECKVLTFGQDAQGFYAIIDGKIQVDRDGNIPYHYVSVEGLYQAYKFSRNGQFSYDDVDALANKWAEYQLDAEMFNVNIRPPDNMIDLLESFGGEAIEDSAPAVDNTNPAESKMGEVYQLGEHRLICGDATQKSVIDSLMDGEMAKVVFTSPPYNMGGEMYQTYSDDLKSEEYIKFNIQTIQNIQQHLKGFLFWNISYNKNSRWEFIEIMYKIIKECNLEFLELIVWDKGHGIPITTKDMLTREYEDVLMVGDHETVQQEIELISVASTERKVKFHKPTGGGITNYWRIGTQNTQTDTHADCFPVKLPYKGIKMVSVKGDIVIDPFAGTGTTMIACEQLGNKCYQIELDPKYCDVIRKRYAKFKGMENQWKELTPKI